MFSLMNKLRLFILKFVVTLMAKIQRKIKYKLHNQPFFMMDSCNMNDKLKYADCSKIMESIVIGYLHTLLLRKRTSTLFARLLFLNSFFHLRVNVFASAKIYSRKIFHNFVNFTNNHHLMDIVQL